MIHCVASARQALQPFWGYFLVVETQKGEPGVRYQNTVLGEILKVVPRRVFGSIVSQHQGDRYGKDFHSWDHLVTLLYGQLGGVSSLRELVELWNVQAPHHYHLGSGPVCRSTVSDANQRRPSAIFAELFAHLTDLASRSLRHDGKQVLRLIDATPIPLTSLHEWASWNGRTRGLKAHVVYDPNVDRPVHLEITSSTVNDVMIARDLSIERGAIYVFDKAYVDYHWWHRLHDASCIFITRPKTNVRFTVIKKRRLSKSARDASIFSDATVRLASQQKTSLPINLRRIELHRDDGRVLSILTNDLKHSAVKIAALYRKRWQIELLFRWIKQHLKIRAFFGRSENAVRLQLFAALIAYLLLRIVAAASRSRISGLRFVDLVRSRLFERCPIARIDKPPPRRSPSTKQSPSQMAFAYA
jgi:putative transposase